MRYAEIVESVNPPKPLPENIADAIHHADHAGNGWKKKDFNLSYIGFLTVDQIEEFDDLSGWLEVDNEDDIKGFRNGSFAAKPPVESLPPIIVITAPDEGECHTQIGDGRGRVNYANGMGIKLHVWHLVHKSCA